MVGKRKVDQLRTNIAKMARAAESGDKEEFQKASQNVPNLLENIARIANAVQVTIWL